MSLLGDHVRMQYVLIIPLNKAESYLNANKSIQLTSHHQQLSRRCVMYWTFITNNVHLWNLTSPVFNWMWKMNGRSHSKVALITKQLILQLYEKFKAKDDRSLWCFRHILFNRCSVLHLIQIKLQIPDKDLHIKKSNALMQPTVEMNCSRWVWYTLRVCTQETTL